MNVSIALVRAVLAEVERQGISSAEIVRLAGIEPSVFADPGGHLPIPRYTRLVRAAIERSIDPAFGLHAGRKAPTGAANVVGYVLVNSGTLREALEMFLRYGSLLMEEATFSFRESGSEASFGFVHPGMPSDVERFEAELVLSFGLVRFGRHFVGPRAELREVRFRHAAPPWVEVYERVFQCPVAFEREENELVFDRDYLDVRQYHSDSWIFELLRERADSMLRARKGDDRLVERVKELLECQIGVGSLDAGAVARGVGLGARTLRRRLADAGFSLRGLHDEARREIACEGLRATHRSIKDVAYELGFSEPSAFHRAFKRWTGLTPQQFRDAATSQHSAVA